MRIIDLKFSQHMLFPDVWIAGFDTLDGLRVNVVRRLLADKRLEWRLRYGQADNMNRVGRRTDWTWDNIVPVDDLNAFLKPRKLQTLQAKT